MPGHAFDDPLMIHPNDGCLTPSGPLGLAAGETGLRLDIWVFQGRAACMAFQRNPAGTSWEMHPAPPDDHVGDMFQPGPAIGMGLLVKTDAHGQKIVEQWTSFITLVDKL